MFGLKDGLYTVKFTNTQTGETKSLSDLKDGTYTVQYIENDKNSSTVKEIKVDTYNGDDND